MFCLFGTGLWAAAAEKSFTVVYNRGIAPIKFTTESGEPSGILNEYWQQLGEKAGLNFKFLEVDSFGESLEMVKSGEMDLHAGIFYTDERSQFLEYSKPIFDLKYYIYSTADVPVMKTLEETRGFFLGVVQGGYTENFIKKVIPEGNLIIYDDYVSLFNAVLKGDVKVFVASDIHLNYYLSVNHHDNPFQHNDTVLCDQIYFGATAKSNRTFIDTIRGGQNLLSENDKKIVKFYCISLKKSR